MLKYCLDESFQKADFVYFLAYDVGGSKYLKENQNSSDFLNNNLLLIDTLAGHDQISTISNGQAYADTTDLSGKGLTSYLKLFIGGFDNLLPWIRKFWWPKILVVENLGGEVLCYVY